MSSARFPAFDDLWRWPASQTDHALQQWWQDLPPPRPDKLAVAFSGGADSTALLLAAVRLCHQAAAGSSEGLPHAVVALHVHHGLQPSADAFSRHCEQACAVLREPAAHIGCALEYVELPLRIVLARGDSVEARAREERYRALAQAALATGSAAVLLGHNADDQAESVLLALSRGAGVAGLAAMAPRFERYGAQFARPLLTVSSQALRAWLQEHQVSWVDDPSNADHRYTRNKLRHVLMPAVERAMPAFRTSFARSARLAAQADVLLQDLAQLDLLQIGNPPQIALLQQLSPQRQANVLRHWLKSTYGAVGSESQLRALLRVLSACTTRGHQVHIKVGNGLVLREGRVLTWKPLQF